MWAAAGHLESSPVLDWLATIMTNGRRLEFHETTIDAQEAVRDDWGGGGALSVQDVVNS